MLHSMQGICRDALLENELILGHILFEQCFVERRVANHIKSLTQLFYATFPLGYAQYIEYNGVNEPCAQQE